MNLTQVIDAAIKACPRVLDYISSDLQDIFIFKSVEYWLKFYTGQDIASIEDEYNTKLYGVMDDYTQTDRPITAFKNAFKRVVYEGFFAAAKSGWIDGGAKGSISEDVTSYVNARFERETQFIDELFKELKEKRKTGTADEVAGYIKARADGYTGTLDGVYVYAKMAAQKERIGIWRYGDTVAHCQTCSDLEGEKHPLSWFIDNGYIPRQRGSTTLECGGWHCECEIVDAETGERIV